MTYTVTLVPGDGTGPELTEAARRVLEATGVSFAWDVQHAGVDVMGSAGTPLPPGDARVDQAERRRTEGADHDADRDGVPLGQRRAPARARPLRVRAAVQELPGCAVALRGRRPRGGPREHGRPLRRHRVRVRHRRRARGDRVPERAAAEADQPHVGDLDQADQPGRLGAHHPLRASSTRAPTGDAASPASPRRTS